MNRQALLLGLGLACVVQWAVPLALIQRGQATLAEGTAYKFRTAPVDPSDPFRGRYVTLDFAAAQVPTARVEAGLHEGQRAYAAISVDADGYAQLRALGAAAPDSGDYLPVTVRWVDFEAARVSLPFDRYYADEQQAPQLEQQYRESNRRIATPDGEVADAVPAALPTYATVRVRRGYAVIENLVIGGALVRPGR